MTETNKPETKNPMTVEVETLEKELVILTDKYNVIGNREKQQCKNLIDKIETRKLLENYAYKGVSITDILKNAIKESDIPESDKVKIKDIKEKVKAYQTIMG